MRKEQYKTDVRRLKNGKVYVYPDYTIVSARIDKTILSVVDSLATKNRRKRSSMMLELVREALVTRGMVQDD